MKHANNKSKSKKWIIIVAIIVAIVVVLGLVGKFIYDQNYRNDLKGNPVYIGKQCERVVDLYPEHVNTMIFFGQASKLVAVGANDKNSINQWARYFDPSVEKLPSVKVEPDVDVLREYEPDLVIVNPQSSDEYVQNLRKEGLNVAYLQPRSLNMLKDSVNLLGAAIKGDMQKKAESFSKLIDSNKKYYQTDIYKLYTDNETYPEHHLTHYMDARFDDLLTTQPGNSIASEIVGLTEGQLLINEDEGANTWDLPVQSLRNSGGMFTYIGGAYQHQAYDEFTTSQLFANNNSVKNNTVYLSPMGLNDWFLPGPEALLMLHYMWFKCQTLYTKVTGDSLESFYELACQWYSEYSGVQLTPDQIKLMTEGKNPDSSLIRPI